jgi:hypothetical protein
VVLMTCSGGGGGGGGVRVAELLLPVSTSTALCPPSV